MTNIVIPMAGLGSRFAREGYAKPKPFIDVAGRPMITRVMENLRVPDARYILIARSEHLAREVDAVKEIVDNYNAVFIPIDLVTEGAACTVLFARAAIDSDDPLLIANSDQIVDLDFSSYLSDMSDRALDGSILTFVDETRNPKWSFARTDESGFVVEVKEKVPISSLATVGVYAFRSGRLFVNSAVDMIVRNERVNNEFYVCPVYNQAIRTGAQIGTYTIAPDSMHGIGTPEDLNAYLRWRSVSR
jgi:dTDP-glucose pyrophosphorylase